MIQLSKQNLRDYWIFRLAFNLVGYASVGVPIFVLIFLVKKRRLLERIGPDSAPARLIRQLVYGEEASLINDAKSPSSKSESYAIFLYIFLLAIFIF